MNKMIPLGEIGKIDSGIVFPNAHQGANRGDLPFAKVADISHAVASGGYRISQARNYVSVHTADVLRATPFPSDTIVFAKIGEAIRLNNRAVTTRAMLFDNNVMGITPRSDIIDVRYLYFFLKTVDFYRFAHTTAVPALRKTELSEMMVPLPALPQQQKVANLLEAAHRLVRMRRHALQMCDEILPATFIEMFGDPTRNDRHWPTEEIGELGHVTTGGTPPSSKPQMFGNAVPFITPGDLEHGYRIRPVRYLSDDGAAHVGTVRAGSTLVCCIGATTGKTDIAYDRCAFNQQINAIEWDKTIIDAFGLQLMRFFSPVVATRARSTTLPILKKSAFEEIVVPTPPVPLQKQFAALFFRHERLRATHVEALRQADHLFQTLLHQSFEMN